MGDYKKLGGGTICEVSTVGLSRDPKFCAKLSEESGVNVIMGTGYYVHAAQTDATKASTVEVMNQFIQNELKNGFTECPGELYPGLVGEMGCSWPITEWERRHLQAAGMLHEPPGFETAPISIHPGRNEKAPEEIVRILTEAGGKEKKLSWVIWIELFMKSKNSRNSVTSSNMWFLNLIYLVLKILIIRWLLFLCQMMANAFAE